MEGIFEEIHNEFINSDLYIQYLYELSLYGEKDYRKKSDREKPKFFSKKSKDFKDRNFNAGNRKKYKNKESFN